ncbi:tetraspanin-1-like [Hoplias malabaricus]|uniref:tetraspanin-1-like n=1 Tax=Hoplias malabaricus TaxID=27720 RepID=UPI003462F426
MCCTGFLKIIMFVFNGLIFLAGGAILGVGIWVAVDKNSLLGILNAIDNAPSELAQLANVGYLLIAVGSILVIMGFLGCCGAITENKCMLLTFFIILLIIFIAEVAGAIVVLVFQPLAEELLQKLNENFVEAIRNEYGTNPDFTNLMNNTMTQLKCCGYNNYTDFVNDTKIYPDSCCTEISGPCTQTEAANEPVQGCFQALVNLLEKNAIVIGGVALGIAALEIAAMVVSMVLYNNVGK